MFDICPREYRGDEEQDDGEYDPLLGQMRVASRVDPANEPCQNKRSRRGEYETSRRRIVHVRDGRGLALVVEQMLLAEDGLSIEELGSGNRIAELFEELLVVGAVDSRGYSLLTARVSRLRARFSGYAEGHTVYLRWRELIRPDGDASRRRGSGRWVRNRFLTMGRPTGAKVGLDGGDSS